LRICIIGKFPPIQGGVSMRTYWTAHALAQRGHDVHVVTNAKEAIPPFRMHMRKVDWGRCEGTYGAGRVTVHWTDPVDRSQSYLPMASPFVTKLATLAANAHAAHPFDIIYSHYLEPYGVAGYLLAQMSGVPQVVRMAGSDAGRLWQHPQFEALYDHILRSAAVVVAGGRVAERAIARGVNPARIALGGGYRLPEDLFVPEGPRIDLGQLRSEVERESVLLGELWGTFPADRPYFGVYGKLGDTKGSFALLEALRRLRLTGSDVGLVALAHGKPEIEARFRARAAELELTDRILQMPFIPHWRVPEFLRSCLAVCCLEQDFPIDIHSPVVPLEVLLCGRCLVGSTEVIRKFPSHERLPDRYGCIAVKDVNDAEALSRQLAAIARDPQPSISVGARGRKFALELQERISFPEPLELVLEAAASRRKIATALRVTDHGIETGAAARRFPLTLLVAAAMEKKLTAPRSRTISKRMGSFDLAMARELLEAIKRSPIKVDRGRCWTFAIEIELAIAEAEEAESSMGGPASNCLFRLHTRRWALGEGGLTDLFPRQSPHMRVIEFEHDVTGFLMAKSAAQFPKTLRPGPAYIIAFSSNGHQRRDPLLVDRETAAILSLCDGTRTASDIANQNGASHGSSSATLDWIEELFLQGLLTLEDSSPRPID
jgi:glycosyltransferase involved in cell wall biosynthesis